eukprot:911277-Pyramimonas_sp.AAC.1
MSSFRLPDETPAKMVLRLASGPSGSSPSLADSQTVDGDAREEGASIIAEEDAVAGDDEDEEDMYCTDDESEKRERMFLDDMVDAVNRVYNLFETHGIKVAGDIKLKVKSVVYSYILEFMLNAEVNLPSGKLDKWSAVRAEVQHLILKSHVTVDGAQQDSSMPCLPGAAQSVAAELMQALKKATGDGDV